MKRIKWNWGTGIVLLFVVFFIITLSMVFIAFRQRVDLVDENYYEKELQFQQQIDKQKNMLNLKLQPSYTAAGTTLFVTIPQNETGRVIGGKVLFYRPADSRSDFTIPLSVDTSGIFTYDLKGKPSGIWKVVLDFQAAKKTEMAFYSEKEFILTKTSIEPR